MMAERIDTDPVAKRGMAVSRGTLLGLLILRLALFVFELVYCGIADAKVGVISNLLLLPFLMIIYMIYDGNKGLSSVLMISAIVRAVCLFSSLPEGNGANAYIGAYLAVMAYQFAVTLLMTSYGPAVAYFKKMQAINMELGAILRGGSPRSGSSANKKH